MHLLYIDESGTSAVPGNTSHFVLAGISIPIQYWKAFDIEIAGIKSKYELQDAELHVAWLMRKYLEQDKIVGFSTMSRAQRRAEVQRYRIAEILRLQRVNNIPHYKRTKKTYAETKDYVHLTFDERSRFVTEVARHVSQWGFARLFAECVDKRHFDPIRAGKSIDERCFEQIVSRFEHYLQAIAVIDPQCCGLLIHDNNPTVAGRHTQMMKRFHQVGTMWTNISRIIETPLFVDSQLTSMVQIADLCAYALRRYIENGEEQLFDLVFPRADRRVGQAVGVRHFARPGCGCKICAEHRV